jgi:hypothetical protein
VIGGRDGLVSHARKVIGAPARTRRG